MADRGVPDLQLDHFLVDRDCAVAEIDADCADKAVCELIVLHDMTQISSSC